MINRGARALPYRPGQWVVMHGYPGCPGFVFGYMGSSPLRGITDGGREWCEHWGHLDSDAPRPRQPMHLLPHPPRPTSRRGHRRPSVEVEAAFVMAGLLKVHGADGRVVAAEAVGA